ncbi:MAG: PAS domain S-box protein [Ignavibacteria bacterium]|nr:PAS domain S-box protein [Ignavibacteria bacterium]
MSAVIRAVLEKGMPRTARFYHIAHGGNEPFDFVFSPCTVDGVDCVCLQPVGYKGFRPGGDEGGLDLNLLVKERTAEISELNGFLGAIVDSSTETFIIAIGTNGTVLSFNEGACRMFLYPRNEVVGRIYASQLYSTEEQAQYTWEEMERSAKVQGKSRRTVTLQRRDGSTFPALVDLTPLRNAERQSLGTLFLGRDITESLRTQQALEEKRDQLEFINSLSLRISQTLELEAICALSLQHLNSKFDSAIGGVYLKNRNDGTLRLVSIEPRERRETYGELLAPTVDDYILAEEGEVLLHDLSHFSAVGMRDTEAPMTKLMLPLLPKASFIGVLVLLVNTSMTRSEELLSFLSAIGTLIGGALENAALYLESLNKSIEIKKQNQELDEFAYVVSHDLKEPLAGISFISNMLVDDYFEMLDSTGKTYVNSLIEFSKRLGSLIDALLELSRIGRITQPPEVVDIAEVLHTVSQNLAFRLSKDDVEFVFPETSPKVIGDKTRIEQVFHNLVSNAFKFNDKPHIRVEIRWRETGDGFVEFSIGDNGIGIEPEYFEKIFKIFERLHQREEYEGNGAGLTIVKKIVENHGGRIWLDSLLDHGTTFYFTLPVSTQNDSSGEL